MYQALYRKYRPKTFDEIVGQEHITKTLANQIQNNQIGHAYLFTGSRGTGKTSTAKIFARAINCTHPQNGSPCYECDVCKALYDANNVDVVEIDAASNNRVDEIRDIREKVKFLPVNGKYKVYIIDEVHMLTDSAFNALLKTLEEPPAHIVFILATTEVHKLPATILSRCMRFDFHLIEDQVLINQLKDIFKKEQINCQEDAYKLIAKAAEGSDRDMLSIADCLVAYSGGEIKTEDVMKILGNTSHEIYLDICRAVHNKDVGLALTTLSQIERQGKNMTVVAKDLTLCFRNLLVAKTCKDASLMLGLITETYNKYVDLANICEINELMENMKIFSAIEGEIKYALSPKTLIETAIISCISDNEKKN